MGIWNYVITNWLCFGVVFFGGGVLSLKRGLLAAANRLLDQKQPYLGEMWFATYG